MGLLQRQPNYGIERVVILFPALIDLEASPKGVKTMVKYEKNKHIPV